MSAIEAIQSNAEPVKRKAARFREKPRHIPNYLFSDAESKKLVSAIEEYWHKRGHTAVRARVEECVVADNGGRTRHICVVRSNIAEVVRFGHAA